jgi:hypothetical protein
MTRLLLLTFGTIPLLSPPPAWAHALGAQWSMKGDKVVVEAFYSGYGTPAQAALVRVFRDTDLASPLLETRTDATGACSFPCPEPGKYRIVVDAGAGHRKELAMEIDKPPTMISGITLAWGSASLCGIDNLSMLPILARDCTEDRPLIRGTDREEFTSYPWRSVILVVGGLALIALVFWMRTEETCSDEKQTRSQQ